MALMLPGATVVNRSAAADDSAEAEFALSREGNAERGRRIFGRCRTCHTIDGNGSDSPSAPDLAGIFGRRAGSEPDFASYSLVLRNADFVWTESALDRWISDPQNFLPGNKMSLAPLRNEQDRKDLIAFLREATTGR